MLFLYMTCTSLIVDTLPAAQRVLGRSNLLYKLNAPIAARQVQSMT
jgi:hypothetical protein